jgi:hypothetical protein
MWNADTHSSVDDDIMSAKENRSLSRIGCIGYLVEEESIIRPVEMLQLSVETRLVYVGE